MDQIVIPITGALALWLITEERKPLRRAGSIVGLIGQPFWFYATWTADQWGMFAISFVYLAIWLKSFYFNWIKEEKNEVAQVAKDCSY